MTQQIRKVLQELGRAGAPSGSTYHPPFSGTPGRKTHFTNPKKNKTKQRKDCKYNILFRPNEIKLFVMVIWKPQPFLTNIWWCLSLCLCLSLSHTHKVVSVTPLSFHI